jgi:exonuclease SbcD
MAGGLIRIIHFADLHLGIESYGSLDPQTGVSRRVKDFLNRLDEVVNYAIESEADLVLFCGDAYKGRNPLPDYQKLFASRVMRLAEAGIPLILVAGNHDLPGNPQKASSLEIFNTLKVPNVYFCRRPDVIRLVTKHGPIQVAVMPYPPRATLQALAVRGDLENFLEEEIRELASKVDPEIPSVLAGHFGVIGAKYSSERTITIGEDFQAPRATLLSGPWDYVALGHIHCFQDLNPGEHPPIVYSGSLERIDFSEEREGKGFVEVYLRKGEAVPRFIPVKARPFLTIYANLANEEDAERALLNRLSAYQVEEAVVRVKVTLAEGQTISDERVRDALANCFYFAGVEREVRRHPRWGLSTEAVESLSKRELLERYFVSKKLPRERIEKLLEYFDKLSEEVEE